MSGKQGRCIGVIGGLGPGATVHYYQALLRAHAEREITSDLVIVHADMARVLGAVGQGDLAGLARYLAGLIDRLAKAGAEVAVIPAITPHVCLPQLLPLSCLPLISIIEIVRAGLAARGLRRVALFGTRFTVESDMFGQLAEFDIVRPRADEAEIVYRIYGELGSAGVGTEAQAEQLRAVAKDLIARESLEAIVIAGTELALIVDEARASYPILDCTGLHIDAIADYASCQREFA
ncbi:MAG TPA: aspartate/glutamate racemase family protein [Alphaproteobacteria bacterium]|nr:aspartate/glutamate racemase family protein [Alphaproteobacteria bacterium]